jgi:hypothetical protein
MVQIGSQKYRMKFWIINKKLSYLFYSQSWLDLPMERLPLWLNHKPDQKNTGRQVVKTLGAY